MRVVTGEAKGRKLKTLKSMEGTRPIMDRVKTALFDILSREVRGSRFLDLFAGTGGVGIEALSRGAAHATFIEMDRKILQLVRDNLQITKLADRADVLQADAFKFLEQASLSAGRAPNTPDTSSSSYDIVYVAPPQYHEMAARALSLLDTSPLVTDTGLVIVQIDPKEREAIVAVPCIRLALSDERRYGNTLLMFYRKPM